jgi:hypothetical protein
MMLPFLLTMTLATAPAAGDAQLAAIAERAARAGIAAFPERPIKEDEIGVSIGRINRTAQTVTIGSFRGGEKMYPASVVKLFFLAHAGYQMDMGELTMTPELERGIRDMIVASSNDATALVVDTLTGTTGGPELSGGALQEWLHRRQATNRWFTAMGYEGVMACQKTWNEAPYGRERQGYGPNLELRNMLTPDACTRLMAEIALDRVASPQRCEWMRGYLRRAIIADGVQADGQSRGYIGKVVPRGAKHFSKAGWTSEVRHDTAYIVAPDGQEVVLTIFTKGHSNTLDLLPKIAEEALRELGVIPADAAGR